MEISNHHLGMRNVAGYELTSTFDLVEPLQFLYVRIVKGNDLSGEDVTGTCNPYVEVKVGSWKGNTRYFEKKSNPEWNQVFALLKDKIQAFMMEVFVKDQDFVKDEFIGVVTFHLNEIPQRVLPDSPLAPQWYMLKDRTGNTVKGGLMLAVWWGTQADEAFLEAWHLDATAVGGNYGLSNIEPKKYISPKLWYLTVNVIEAKNLQPADNSRTPEIFVKAILGHQALRTKICQSETINPIWNENLMLVAAEPFDEALILSVVDRVPPMKEEVIGKCEIRFADIDRKLDDQPINTKWFNLTKHVAEGEREIKLASEIHLRICLEGGYHVLDEAYHYSSDFRPTAEELSKPSIGVLDLGILKAEDLMPVKEKDGRGRTDAYCVAKYGPEWVRTRTIIDSSSPKWNEQYTWKVFDPCTVITIVVFDNSHLQEGENAEGVRDHKLGKVRIRLSTLETDRVYAYSFPLLVFQPSGIKKMGYIQLAVRFTCPSFLNMMHMYSQPLFPKMHDLHPLTINQLDSLRQRATQIVSMKLSQAEPPLRTEVIKYILDVDPQLWSLRRSKANFFRMMGVVSGLISLLRWFDQICNWKKPITTVLIHILFIVLVLYPEYILPLFFLYLFFIGIWNYRWRPKHPTHMDTRLSHADSVHPDELDEEMDTFPTSSSFDIVTMRYDRLRSIAGRIQTVVGDLAELGERLQNLLRWRDSRATTVVVTVCLIAVVILHVIPLRFVVLLTGLYELRHPWFRSKLPPVPLNFFRRLPSRSDCTL
ncbi:hypothetical protein SLA2020_076260 [Shorea laevis]